MKVCTDACILGAWFADKAPAWSSVLDIGSGTGLLMLMLAQKHKGEIRGIELDLEAFRQLQDNIGQSPWRQMLRVFPGDARTFSFPGKFDFIISNPPFYENDLPAATTAANLARHSKELTLAELLTAIDAHPHLLERSLYLGKDISIGGTAHQAGTMRFGADAQSSVLNLNCRAHQLDNLYVVDASFFPSIGAVNPTLTIIANALRVADHLIARMG